jgi:hypothetical protein
MKTAITVEVSPVFAVLAFLFAAYIFWKVKK